MTYHSQRLFFRPYGGSFACVDILARAILIYCPIFVGCGLASDEASSTEQQKNLAHARQVFLIQELPHEKGKVKYSASHYDSFGSYRESAMQALTRVEGVIDLSFENASPQTSSESNPFSYIKQFRKLEALACAEGGVEDEHLMHIDSHPSLKHVLLRARGGLKGNRFTDKGLRSLTTIPQLKRLVLEGSCYSDVGLQHVGSIKSLESLYLGGYYTDNGLNYLRQLKNLKQLCVVGNLTDESMQYLSSLTNLRALWLYSNKGKLAGQGLSQLSKLPHLQLLGLRGFDSGASLKDLDRLAHLELLDLSELNSNQATVSDSLLNSIPPMTKLRSLSLRSTQVSDAGFSFVKKLPNLEELDLRYTTIGDLGVKQVGQLNHLKVLILGDPSRRNLITTQGMDALVHLPELSWLDLVYVDTSKISPHSVPRFQSLKKLTVAVECPFSRILKSRGVEITTDTRAHVSADQAEHAWLGKMVAMQE